MPASPRSAAPSGPASPARVRRQRGRRAGSAHAAIQHELLLHQVDGQGLEAGPVLRPAPAPLPGRHPCSPPGTRGSACAAPDTRSPPGARGRSAPGGRSAAAPCPVQRRLAVHSRPPADAPPPRSGVATRCNVWPRWPSCPTRRSAAASPQAIRLAPRPVATTAACHCRGCPWRAALPAAWTRAANCARCSRACSDPSRKYAFAAFSAAFPLQSVMCLMLRLYCKSA